MNEMGTDTIICMATREVHRWPVRGGFCGCAEGRCYFKSLAKRQATAISHYEALLVAPTPPQDFVTLTPARLLDWGMAYRIWFEQQRAVAIASTSQKSAGAGQ